MISESEASTFTDSRDYARQLISEDGAIESIATSVFNTLEPTFTSIQDQISNIPYIDLIPTIVQETNNIPTVAPSVITRIDNIPGINSIPSIIPSFTNQINTLTNRVDNEFTESTTNINNKFQAITTIVQRAFLSTTNSIEIEEDAIQNSLSKMQDSIDKLQYEFDNVCTTGFDNAAAKSVNGIFLDRDKSKGDDGLITLKLRPRDFHIFISVMLGWTVFVFLIGMLVMKCWFGCDTYKSQFAAVPRFEYSTTDIEDLKE